MRTIPAPPTKEEGDIALCLLGVLGEIAGALGEITETLEDKRQREILRETLFRLPKMRGMIEQALATLTGLVEEAKTLE